MSAYVIVDVAITDPVPYEEYKQRTPATLVPYGGRFLVHGGACEVYEGDWQPGRIVVIVFPSGAQARAWYNSPEYQQILPIRTRHAHSKLLIVEGVEPS